MVVTDLGSFFYHHIHDVHDDCGSDPHRHQQLEAHVLEIALDDAVLHLIRLMREEIMISMQIHV